MQKVFRVTVDISKKIPAPAFEVNTNDLKSVKLEITITNGQSLLDLTDVTPRINIRKPDNEVIFQDCEIVDAKAGKVQIVLENQAYLVPGTHTAEIACYKGNEITAITGTFSYKSVKGIMNDEAVESKSEFTAIDRKIEAARKLLEDIGENGVGVDEQARQKIEEVTEQLADTVKEVNGVRPTDGKITLPIPEVDTSNLATKQELQNIGSGSPKGTYASVSALQTAHPTGTTGIYVVSADGKWYYWNGTAWVSGGQYQSTGIAEKTIALDNLNEKLQDNFTEKFIDQTLTFISGGYYDRQGNLVTGTDQLYVSFPVVKGDKFIISGSSYSGMPLYVFVGSDNTKVPFPTTSGSETYHTKVEFKANTNGTLYINKYKWAANGIVLASKLDSYKIALTEDSIQNGGVTLSKLESGLQQSFIESYSKQSPTFTSGSYIDRSGTTITGAGYFYTTIQVRKGEKYKISGPSYYSMPLYIFIDGSNNKTSYPATQSGEVKHLNIDFTANADGTLYVNKNWVTDATVLKNAGYVLNNNPLYGKTMYADGDSVARGEGSSGNSYVDIIANNNAMGYRKMAVSGTTLAKRSGKTDSILERVTSMTGNYDYILLEGGYNDMFNTVPIGSLTNGFSTTLDENTVIGAVETIAKKLITSYPTSKKLFVLGHRAIGLDGSYFTQIDTYWNAIISALEKWSIPYIDLRKSSGLMAYNQDWLTKYFGAGETMGTHPNLAGYQNFYVPQITSKLKSL